MNNTAYGYEYPHRIITLINDWEKLRKKNEQPRVPCKLPLYLVWGEKKMLITGRVSLLYRSVCKENLMYKIIIKSDNCTRQLRKRSISWLIIGCFHE